jgi:hypothetical protein
MHQQELPSREILHCTRTLRPRSPAKPALFRAALPCRSGTFRSAQNVSLAAAVTSLMVLGLRPALFWLRSTPERLVYGGPGNISPLHCNVMCRASIDVQFPALKVRLWRTPALSFGPSKNRLHHCSSTSRLDLEELRIIKRACSFLHFMAKR